MKKLLLPIIVGAALCAAGFARTWTSADGSNTFEGEFVSAADGKVTVLRNGREVTFKEELLSEEDREFIKAELAAKDEEAAAKKAAEEAKSAPVPSALDGKLMKLDGKSLKAFEPAGVPEYYLVYFSASWCGPCRKSAPGMVEYYNETIAKNDKVELIWMNRDRDEGAMEGFIKEFGMPWPVVEFKSKDDIKPFMAIKKNFVPQYALVDRNGDVVAEDLASAKAKIAELK
ncbi:MAG: thioredoxin-like domain-containing protein [Verrucomicrobiales bacterium]